MLLRLWVMRMNCVSLRSCCNSWVKRPTFASSRGASASSRVEEGDGEGGGTIGEQGDQERHGGQRLLSPGQQGDLLQSFAGRLGDDLDAGLENVLLVLLQPQLGPPAAEQRREALHEVPLDRL